jgi:hypothetical protein
MSEFPNKRDAKDDAYLTMKAALSALPVVGGPLAELFGAVIMPSLDKRRVEWLNALSEGLSDLQQRVEGLSFENLAGNELFVSNVLQASQAALRTHQEDKLIALRNAVLNTLLPNAPDEDQQSIFLNYVDTLTPWHLRILKFFEDPRVWGVKNNVSYPHWSSGGPSSVLEHTFPELKDRRDFYDQIVKDLHSRGLLNTEQLHMMMTESGMFASRTTKLGKSFIGFITLKED